MLKKGLFGCSLFLAIVSYGSLALSQRSGSLPDVIGADVPLYPPIARAAKVQGTVVLTVVVDGGKVQSTKVMSGPPLLSEAAESNLKTWKLVPMAAQTFAVSFHYKLSDRCKGRPSVIADFPTGVTVCSTTSPPLD